MSRELRSLEAEVAYLMSLGEIPKAPEVRPAAPELAEPELHPENPHTPATSVACALLALVTVAVGVLT